MRSNTLPHLLTPHKMQNLIFSYFSTPKKHACDDYPKGKRSFFNG